MDSIENTPQEQLTYDQLAAKIADVEAENRELRTQADRIGLAFKDIPEEGDAELLADGYLPVLIKDDYLSLYKPDEAETNANTLLIEGDNISALFALQHTHKGKVDVIYIDPPYNTGSDGFIYEDKRVHQSELEDLKGIETDLDGEARLVGKNDPFRHSKWLAFMRRRLYLARTLLSETGVIFISIDDNEQARLKILMDEIFGEDNFIANIVWRGGKKNNTRFVSVGHDYILVVAKNKEKLIEKDINWRIPKKGLAEAAQLAEKIWQLDESYERKNGNYRKGLALLKKQGIIGDSVFRYDLLDETTGKAFNADGDLSAPGGGGQRYILLHPKTGLAVTVPERGWAWSKERMNTNIKAGMVFFGENEKKIPRKKTFLENIGEEVFDSVFYQERSAGSEQLEAVIGKKLFSFPKEVSTLKTIFSMVSHQNSLTLDFFAGSGTTAHAIVELNKEDGGNRQCILVTNNEAGIAENVTATRVKRVLSGENWADGKEHEPLPGELHYYKLSLEKFSEDHYQMLDEMYEKYNGMAALETNSHRELLKNEDYTLLAGENTLALVWNDAFSMQGNPDSVTEALEEISSKYDASNLSTKYIYLPSFDEKTLIKVPEGWIVKIYPREYLTEFTNNRVRLIGADILHPTTTDK
jgi:DNA modification methylase